MIGNLFNEDKYGNYKTKIYLLSYMFFLPILTFGSVIYIKVKEIEELVIKRERDQNISLILLMFITISTLVIIVKRSISKNKNK